MNKYLAIVSYVDRGENVARSKHFVLTARTQRDAYLSIEVAAENANWIKANLLDEPDGGDDHPILDTGIDDIVVVPLAALGAQASVPTGRYSLEAGITILDGNGEARKARKRHSRSRGAGLANRFRGLPNADCPPRDCSSERTGCITPT